jgi:hypothetical protein
MALTAAYASGSYRIEIPHLRAALSELIESQPMENDDRWFKKILRFWWWFAVGMALWALIALKWYHPVEANDDQFHKKIETAHQLKNIIPRHDDYEKRFK